MSNQGNWKDENRLLDSSLEPVSMDRAITTDIAIVRAPSGSLCTFQPIPSFCFVRLRYCRYYISFRKYCILRGVLCRYTKDKSVSSCRGDGSKQPQRGREFTGPCVQASIGSIGIRTLIQSRYHCGGQCGEESIGAQVSGQIGVCSRPSAVFHCCFFIF